MKTTSLLHSRPFMPPLLRAALLACTLTASAQATLPTAQPVTAALCRVTATWEPLLWSYLLSRDAFASFRAVTIRTTVCPAGNVARVAFVTETGVRPIAEAVVLGGPFPHSYFLSGVPWWWHPVSLTRSGKAYAIPYRMLTGPP